MSARGLVTRVALGLALVPGDIRAFFGYADNPAARRAFLRYYALRASAAYSAGAHDLRRARALPGATETEISPDYEVR